MVLLLQEGGWLEQPDGCRISSGERQRVVASLDPCVAVCLAPAQLLRTDRKYSGDNERVIVQVGDQ